MLNKNNEKAAACKILQAFCLGEQVFKQKLRLMRFRVQ